MVAVSVADHLAWRAIYVAVVDAATTRFRRNAHPRIATGEGCATLTGSASVAADGRKRRIPADVILDADNLVASHRDNVIPMAAVALLTQSNIHYSLVVAGDDEFLEVPGYPGHAACDENRTGLSCVPSSRRPLRR